MASWIYAFAVPIEHQLLDVSRCLHVFKDNGLELGEHAAQVRVDEDGHCEPSDVWHELPQGNGWREASRLLDSGMDLHVELSDQNLIFACTFARSARNPHVSLGWSSRIFTALSVETQGRYLAVVSSFSEMLEATAVIILLNAPGYFEDQIVVSGKDVIVDAIGPEDSRIEICEIWAKGSVDIHGAEPRLSGERIGNFDRYHAVRH
jgi:hypothetical protein